MATLDTSQGIDGTSARDWVDQADECVSIWDIRRGWRDKFWIVFSVQAFLATVFEGWFEFEFGIEPSAWHQARSIIANMVPYIVLIGPASYLITEVFVMLSEKYLTWRRRRSREALSGWLTRRQQAWQSGESFDEGIPKAVDWRHIEVNMDLILALPGSLSEERKCDESDQLDVSALKRRVLEMEAWYGRKRLAEDRGEPFSEPFPTDNGSHHSQN